MTSAWSRKKRAICWWFSHNLDYLVTLMMILQYRIIILILDHLKYYIILYVINTQHGPNWFQLDQINRISLQPLPKAVNTFRSSINLHIHQRLVRQKSMLLFIERCTTVNDNMKLYSSDWTCSSHATPKHATNVATIPLIGNFLKTNNKRCYVTGIVTNYWSTAKIDKCLPQIHTRL